MKVTNSAKLMSLMHITKHLTDFMILYYIDTKSLSTHFELTNVLNRTIGLMHCDSKYT